MLLDASFIEFKLDYSGTRNLPIGKPIFDDNGLTAGGRPWMIALFPRGFCKDQSGNGEYISLFAATAGDVVGAGVNTTLFHAFLMGRDGAPSLAHPAKSSSKATVCTKLTWIGWHQFIKRSELESGSSSYVDVDGRVTFVCGIVDLNSRRRIPVPPSDLGDHLGHLLPPQQHSTDGGGDGNGDVSFSVGGETFRAHRAILAARSPVFKAQLFGSMADARMDRITLHGVHPAAFRILLRFLYTDALPASDTELVGDLETSSSSATDDLLQHLLAAADMYQLDRLKLLCAQKLWDSVSPESVAAMLVCAEMHSCPELKKRCIDFFVVEKNLKIAVLTEGYFRLMQGFPSLIDEIRAKLVRQP